LYGENVRTVKQQSNDGFSGSALASSDAGSPQTDKDNEEKQPKAKGKILDISA